MKRTCMKKVFFFSSRRRHTRWTGDWSSDVCSSDLRAVINVTGDVIHREHEAVIHIADAETRLVELLRNQIVTRRAQHHPILRSEERRVGKECRSGWWTE